MRILPLSVLPLGEEANLSFWQCFWIFTLLSSLPHFTSRSPDTSNTQYVEPPERIQTRCREPEELTPSGSPAGEAAEILEAHQSRPVRTCVRTTRP